MVRSGALAAALEALRSAGHECEEQEQDERAPAAGPPAATCTELVVSSAAAACSSGAIDEIIPRLFLGDAVAAQDDKLLQSFGITHIVNAAVNDGVGVVFPENFEYHCVALDDSSDGDIESALPPSASLFTLRLHTPRPAMYLFTAK